MEPTMQTSAIFSRFAGGLRSLAWTLRVSEKTLRPVLDLLIRLTIAQAFFVSGVLKAANWDNALLLAASEYPVSWLDPVAAAWLGAGIELIGSTLLAVGLGTRAAAFSMLVLSLVIQFNYLALDTHLFWAVLLGWYVVMGAGPLSLDAALARGLAGSAIPYATAAVRLAQLTTERLGPLYLFSFRLWVGAAMTVAAGAGLAGVMTPELAALMLPVRTAADLPPWLLAPGALLLALGLATRPTALLLLAALAAGQMNDPGSSQDWYWMLACMLLAVHGAGRLSLDAYLAAILADRFPELAGKPGFSLDGLPRVVIVGAGFGGLTCAARLGRARARVTLIDRHNYHLFQPLLYQVATAGLSPGDIATPVRGLFRDRFNTTVLYGEVSGVDRERREVLLGERRVPYDYLVVATGASHSYFGRDEWGAFAPGLKRIEDATAVRRRMLTAFERAESTEDEDERCRLLTFVIVGGGPTGVELAGAIAELAHHGLDQEFRNFYPASARVLLVQAGPRILPAFPETLSAQARKALEALGVEVRLDSRVERIDADGVTISGQRIEARTVLWAAGVVASPAARWLGAQADNAGRVKVAADLSVPGLPAVFVIGDTALSLAWNGQPVPGLAPAAKQGGEYVARVIRARIEGRRGPGLFVYRHLGSLATIGRKAAVADFGWLRLWGAPAWWLWGLVHVGFLVGMRNRVSVMFDWFWAYLTYRSGTRLITGAAEPAQTVAVDTPASVRAAA
jgi:NADH dehydrogenase/putative oxidoreductase